MGDDKSDPRKIVFIRWDKNTGQPDPELMAWLEGFISQLEDEGLLSQAWRDDQHEPSELEQLEYLDSTVTGDEHPEALAWIMAAYDRHQNGG